MERSRGHLNGSTGWVTATAERGHSSRCERPVLADTGPSAAPHRDLAGLCVYQHYLRHLHRLHRSYIHTHRNNLKHQQHHQQHHLPHNLPHHQRQTALLSTQHLKPNLSHSACPLSSPSPRLRYQSTHTAFKERRRSTTSQCRQVTNTSNPKTVSRPTLSSQCGQVTNTSNPKTVSRPTLFPPIPDKKAQTTGTTQGGGNYVDAVSKKDEGKFSRYDAVHIPCGREHSEIWMLKLQMRKRRQRDRDGAWSFRTWRSRQEVSKTLYST